jgi:hypothetical protein
MCSPKSRVRVRVSREFEREREAMDAVREKCRERERQGTALPSQNPPPLVAVKSGGGEWQTELEHELLFLAMESVIGRD